MSVGDLIPPSRRVVQRLLRFAGTAPGGVAAQNDFAEAELFEAPMPPPQAPWRPWRKRVAAGSATRRRSLIQLIETAHDMVEFGTQYGSDAVAVPFTHLVLLGAFTAPLERAARRQIEERLRETVGDYVDDLLGVRVLCRNDGDLAADALVLFFGRGVFVPQSGEQPQGEIVIAEAGPDGAARSEPPLLSHDFEPAPAGFYRGQSGLAFGGSPTRVAATCGLLPFDESSFFYLGPARDDSTGLDLARPAEESAYFYDVRALPADDAEVAFSIDCRHRETGERHLLTLRASRDSRLSRLHRLPPAGRDYLEIAGIVAPQDPDDGVAPRWWIDLDRDNRLIGVSGVGRATSVLYEHGRLTHYDWQDLRFKPEAARSHRLERVKLNDARHLVLRSAADAAFGYLALPQDGQAVTFQQDWWTQAGSYALDWLDFSGGVERASGGLQARGLAADAAQRWRGPRMPGADRARRGNPQGWMLRHPGDAGFRPMPSYDPVAGTELVVGPLVLRVPFD
jgi:hypothetical protein